MQQSFRKFNVFNGLLMGVIVLAAFAPIHRLPDRKPVPVITVTLTYRAVKLSSVEAPLRLAGAWEMEASDPRLGGLSALAAERGRFLAVSDLGAVVRFDPPTVPSPQASLLDLRDGPGRFGKKSSRDAESLVRDPRGRGWWVGYEQQHSLWLYDDRFSRALERVNLPRLGWANNRGAEGLLVRDGALLVLAENGRDALSIKQAASSRLKLHSGAEVADAARGPDGSGWVLLREKGPGGIKQSVGALQKTHDGYLIETLWPLPKAAFDNYEGLAITSLPDGRWRFWLVTDDGHRFQARTLLVALDLELPIARHDKSPAEVAGLSKKPSVETP